MDTWGQPPKQDSQYNPKNRFLFCCCHSDYVDVGWGCGCCGCRAFPFSWGVYIFSLIMIVADFKDIYDIAKSGYIEDLKGLFKKFFIVKLISEFVCLLSIITAIYSVRKQSYCYSIVAYYIAFISFIGNSVFCGYAITRVFEVSFWKTVGVSSPIIWGIVEYIWLLFAWILFCNMVDIKRKENEAPKTTQWGF